MITFLLRRAGYTLVTVWLALTFAFFLLRVLPEDAISVQLTISGATDAQISARRAELSLDQPLITQYLNVFGGLIRGDLSISLSNGRAVTAIIGEQLPSTFALALGGLGVGIITGIWLGSAASLTRLPLKAAARGCLTFLLAAPVYWTGTLAIYIFAVWLDWLPSQAADAIYVRCYCLASLRAVHCRQYRAIYCKSPPRIGNNALPSHWTR